MSVHPPGSGGGLARAKPQAAGTVDTQRLVPRAYTGRLSSLSPTVPVAGLHGGYIMASSRSRLAMALQSPNHLQGHTCEELLILADEAMREHRAMAFAEMRRELARREAKHLELIEAGEDGLTTAAELDLIDALRVWVTAAENRPHRQGGEGL